MKRKIILAHPFDESISKYGYEDILWAQSLKEKNISIHHIDNPVLHTGIHPTKYFLRKTAQAIHNLIYLDLNKKSIETKLIRLLKNIHALGLDNLAFKLYRWNEKRIVQNLLSEHPSLFCLSIYKLGLFMRFRRRTTARN